LDTWSFVELLMSRMTFPPRLPGYRGYGLIGGRFYANVSMSISLEALAGFSPRRFAALVGPVLGKLPPIEEIPRPRLPRWKAIRLMVPAVTTMVRRDPCKPEADAAVPRRRAEPLRTAARRDRAGRRC
jgi:rifampicin phosphotransferase